MTKKKAIKAFNAELKRKNLLLDLETDDDKEAKDRSAKRSKAPRLGVVWESERKDIGNDTWIGG